MVATGASSGRRGRRRRATAWLPRAAWRRARTSSATTERRRRVATIAGSGTVALLAAVAGGAAWYYAGRITEPPGRRPVPPLPDDGVQVRALDEHRIVLAGPAAARPGWWGLAAGDDGWVRVGPAVGEVPLDATEPEAGDAAIGVERPIEHAVGRIGPGTTGRLDPEAVPPDAADLGLTVEDVRVPGPLGPLPAWWFPVSAGAAVGTTAAVLVHGRSGSRREVARWAPTFLRAGVPALALSYRNAPGAPVSPDGRSHLGATEWEDVAAAVAWTLERGARDVVLFGASMGGACVAELLARSDLASSVRAVVLEAPVRHWGPVLRAAARERGLPPAVLPILLPPTMALAGARGRIDWAGLDHLEDPQRYALPTLLVHGDLDSVVPVALSDAFAAARRDVVTYHRVPGAGHLRAWNVDREGSEEALHRFLGAVLTDDHRPGLRDGRPRR